MNKSEIIAVVAESLDMPKARVQAVINATIDTIVEQVSKGETVGITGFGTFSSRNRAARQGRNPQTGAAIDIDARVAPHFKPGSAFKAAVNA